MVLRGFAPPAPHVIVSLPLARNRETWCSGASPLPHHMFIVSLPLARNRET